MNAVVYDYTIPGSVLSLAGLSLVVPVMFIFRQYFRLLDFAQMSYFFALTMYSTSFSQNLATSIANFNYNFLTFCSAGDIVCTLKFQLSFGCVLIGFLILVAFFIGLQRCGGKTNVQFEPMHLAFKGFFKWFYLPCTYYSAYFLASALDLTMNQNNFDGTKVIQAAAIAVFCLLFPIIQLIGYKCIQTQETPIWRKWLEFFNYLRLMATGTLLGLYTYFKADIYLHCVMIALILYPFIFIWKEDFKYPVLERVIFALGEAAFLANFYIFKYGSSYIKNYDIDFFLLAFVLIIDFLLYFVRACRMSCYGVNEYAAISPEVSTPQVTKKQKINKYEHDSSSDLQNSKEGLVVSLKPLPPSPKRTRK